MNINNLEVFRLPYYREFIFKGEKYLLNTYPYLDIILGDACKCKCKFCVADLVHKKLKLDVEIAKKKSKYAKEILGVKEFLLLGGEPTLYNSLFPIISFLKTLRPNKICMTTNGHRIVNDESYAKKVFSSGLTNINFSIMSLDENKQKEINQSSNSISLDNLKFIKELSVKFNVNVRFNNNSFRGNNDTTESIEEFYFNCKNYCDTIKISSLLQTDSFSTIDKVSKFTSEYKLSDEEYNNLFNSTENLFRNKYDCGLIRNYDTLGFVENSLCNMDVPLIFNYNHKGRLMKEFIENKKINNFKLLPNGEISISWNRECKDLFVGENI